ncbi:hypothetical protein Vretimale_11756 [Volvox reticuliferus]|uniref:Uncharacterized protein n=1 Tax=Volvox reticuliferus TaxID=1737510 RepID=A0A8J4GIF9_9CHLO|nr:hypothetical protein Vretimale_11756 [Volvox reticuliferus]
MVNASMQVGSAANKAVLKSTTEMQDSNYCCCGPVAKPAAMQTTIQTQPKRWLGGKDLQRKPTPPAWTKDLKRPPTTLSCWGKVYVSHLVDKAVGDLKVQPAQLRCMGTPAATAATHT